MEEPPYQLQSTIKGKDLPGAIKVMPMGLDAAIKKRVSGEFRSESRGSAMTFSQTKTGNQQTAESSKVTFKQDNSMHSQKQATEQKISSSHKMTSSSSDSQSFRSTSERTSYNKTSSMSESKQMTSFASSDMMKTSKMSNTQQDFQQISEANVTNNQQASHGVEIKQENLKTQIQSAITDLEKEIVQDFENKENISTPVISPPPAAKSEIFSPPPAAKLDIFSPPPLERMEPPEPTLPSLAIPPIQNGHVNSVDIKSKVSDLYQIEESSVIHTSSGQMNGILQESSSNSNCQQLQESDSSSMLQKIMTPAPSEYNSDSLKRRDPRKMFTDSSFYSAKHHPTVADQVEMAHRLSSALFQDDNKMSKGQQMYLNRAKRSGEAMDEDEDTDPRHDKVPNMKLVMNPEGKVHEWSDVAPEDAAEIQNLAAHAAAPNLPSPDVDNAAAGKGGELFAKRRKKAENWVVDESSVGQSKPSNFADKFQQQQLFQQQQFQQQQHLEQQQKQHQQQQELGQQQSEIARQQTESRQQFQQQQLLKQEQSLEIRRQQEQQKINNVTQELDLPENFQHYSLKGRSFTPIFDSSCHNVQGINVWANTAPRGWASGTIARTPAQLGVSKLAQLPAVAVCPATPSVDRDVLEEQKQQALLLQREEEESLIRQQQKLQEEEALFIQKQQEEALLIQKQQEEAFLMQKQQEEALLIQKRQEEALMIQRQQEEALRMQKQQEEALLIQKQQEESLRMQKQQEETLRLQKQQEEALRIQKQQEESLRIQKQQEETLRIQKQQEETLRIQKQQEETLRIQKQQEETLRIQRQQQEAERLAKEEAAAAELQRQQQQQQQQILQQQQQILQQQQTSRMSSQSVETKTTSKTAAGAVDLEGEKRREYEEWFKNQEKEALSYSACVEYQEHQQNDSTTTTTTTTMQQQQQQQGMLKNTTTSSSTLAAAVPPSFCEPQFAKPPTPRPVSQNTHNNQKFTASHSQNVDFSQQKSSLVEKTSSCSQKFVESQVIREGGMTQATQEQAYATSLHPTTTGSVIRQGGEVTYSHAKSEELESRSELRQTPAGQNIRDSGVFGGIKGDQNCLVEDNGEIDYTKHTVKSLVGHFSKVKPPTEIPDRYLPQQHQYGGTQTPSFNYLHQQETTGRKQESKSVSQVNMQQAAQSQVNMQAAQSQVNMQAAQSQVQAESAETNSKVATAESNKKDENLVVTQRRQSLKDYLLMDPATEHMKAGFIDPSSILRGEQITQWKQSDPFPTRSSLTALSASPAINMYTSKITAIKPFGFSNPKNDTPYQQIEMGRPPIPKTQNTSEAIMEQSKHLQLSTSSPQCQNNALDQVTKLADIVCSDYGIQPPSQKPSAHLLCPDPTDGYNATVQVSSHKHLPTISFDNSNLDSSSAYSLLTNTNEMSEMQLGQQQQQWAPITNTTYSQSVQKDLSVIETTSNELNDLGQDMTLLCPGLVPRSTTSTPAPTHPFPPIDSSAHLSPTCTLGRPKTPILVTTRPSSVTPHTKDRHVSKDDIARMMAELNAPLPPMEPLPQDIARDLASSRASQASPFPYSGCGGPAAVSHPQPPTNL